MAPHLQTKIILGCILRSARGQSSFVCNQCRCQIQSGILRSYTQSTPLIGRRHASTASEETPFTEKIRRKLWGSEKPPGQDDPYNPIKNQTQQGEPLPVTAGEQTTTAQLEYVPATTWEGLDHIGGATGWWEESWDAEHKFSSFMPSNPLLSDEVARYAVHRAVVEVFALKEANMPLTAVCQISSNSDLYISDIKFARSKGGDSIVYGHGTTPQNIIDIINTKKTTKTRTTKTKAITSSTARNENENSIELSDSGTKLENSVISDGVTLSEPVIAQNDDPTVVSSQMSPKIAPIHWLAVSLQNDAIKFAVLKRVMQLTGKRISDPAISKISVVGQLVDVLTEKPKPKKLAEQLIGKPELAEMRNVQILDRRYTPIDKEKEVGRWKVIEKELRKRGLPVTGRA